MRVRTDSLNRRRASATTGSRRSCGSTPSSLADHQHDRPGSGHVGEHEEGVDRGWIELAQLRLDLQERRQLRCEGQVAVVLVQEQGLLAEAVASKQQAPAPLVPQREREHSLERVHEGLAVLLVEVHQHLGVRARREAMPARAQILTQLRVIVDLAIERHPHRAVLVAERLMASLDIHDRQAANADSHSSREIGVHPLIVRASVAQRRAHRPHRISPGVVRAPSDPTHLRKHSDHVPDSLRGVPTLPGNLESDPPAVQSPRIAVKALAYIADGSWSSIVPSSST
jgi:hypothetical protein